MNHALEPNHPKRPKHPTSPVRSESFGRIARSLSRAPQHAAEPAGRSANDPEFALRDDGMATALRALAANGFGEAALTRTGEYAHLSAAALATAARSHRVAGWVALHRAMFGAVSDGLRQLFAAYRRRQQARATEQALQALDSRSLRDLGLHRSEISSLARELEQPAAASRVLALPSPRGC